MTETFAQVGDYVMAEYGWPHMGNAEGKGVKICKVTKITSSGKLRLKELPTRRENRVNLDRDVSRWDKIVTSREPEESEKGKLASSNGECTDGRKHLTYIVIPESRLDLPFEEKYDRYN